MKTDISPEKQEQIVNYLMTNLSRKVIKISKFAELTGISATTFSSIKKEENRHVVSNNIWNYLDKIYEGRAFDVVISGGWNKFEPRKESKIMPVSIKEMVHNKKCDDIKTDIQDIAMDQLADMRVKKIPEQVINEKIRDAAYLEAKRSFQSSLKNFAYAQLEALKESEITVGMAIDALIEAGAKINVTIEV